MNVHSKRYILSALAATSVLAAGGAVALSHAPSASASARASARAVNAQQAASENWAGYVARSSGGSGRFSNVSGSWVVPSVSSSTGQGYSAFWVGLGGANHGSHALEQIGTSSDTANGQTQYYAWYEIVPAPETQLNLAVHPGDHMTGKVSVSGSTATLSLSDQTTGQSVTKQVQVSNPDTSSAEWIAEAPSSESRDGGTQVLPLADFGKVTFTNATATSGGHTGSISDPDWSVQQVQLASQNGGDWAGDGGVLGSDPGFVSAQSGAGAQTSSLSSDGSSFSVSYTPDSSSVDTSGSAPGQPGTGDPNGYGGSDPNGYGSGDPNGYGSGDPYGYGGGGGYYVLPGGGGYVIIQAGLGGYGYGV